uniref:Uncharacterized protein n=1 Tax=Hanusia phi TaxID=3032 RepID=A0A7S0NBK2_9CRYP|mmetsp:Transcript_5544/g.12894  ORF Transcript_5544/g.12894 Transcript_5544/m.12894 type:complete len:320 (+) Transcript_5544:283-1242(+)|eukprot:750597-Hanusia_phi.AAC.3
MAEWNAAHRKWDTNSNEQTPWGNGEEPSFAPHQFVDYGHARQTRPQDRQYLGRSDPEAAPVDQPTFAYAHGPFVGIPNMPQYANIPQNVNMPQNVVYPTRRSSRSSESYVPSYPPSVPHQQVDEDVWVSEAWKSLHTRSQSSRSVATRESIPQSSFENVDEPCEHESGDMQSTSSDAITTKGPQLASPPTDLSPKLNASGKNGAKSSEDLSGASSIEDRHSSVNSELELTSSAPSSCVWNPPSKNLDSSVSQAETKVLEKINEKKMIEQKKKAASPSNGNTKKRKDREIPDDAHYGRYDDDSEWTLGPGEPKWKGSWSR